MHADPSAPGWRLMPVSLYVQSTRESGRVRARPRPHLLLVGGVGLAALAGAVNAIGLLGAYHVPVSHMSGAVAHVSIDLVAGDHVRMRVAALMVLCFLVGTVVSGVVIGGQRLMPGRRYGLAMMIEGGALAAGAAALSHGGSGAAYWCAFACGLQNAMATSYCGLVIRTTHVTGVVTDIGILLGHWIRHRRQEPWRLLLLCGLLAGFLVGGLVGAVGWAWWGPYALWSAAAAVGLAGFGYFLWRLRFQRQRRARLAARRSARA